MKKIEDYVLSIPDFPEPGDYFQRYYKCSAGRGWPAVGNRLHAGLS